MKRIIRALGNFLVLPAMAAMTLPAQTLTTVFQFDGTDGDGAYVLVQGADGNLYGVSPGGGTNLFHGEFGGGTVFKISPSGDATTLYNFCSLPDCADGEAPLSLIQAADGNFYGITQYGGATLHRVGEESGTVFEITPSGTLTALYSFCAQSGCADGAFPASLVQAADGDFHGTTAWGGGVCSSDSSGCGTVFKISASGVLTTLYTFCAQSGCPDGSNPSVLIQATDGDLYGTATNGGRRGCCAEGGTLFRITPSGTLTTLYGFCSQKDCMDGADPGALVQGMDGNFYGLTFLAGGHRGGTAFKVTPSGTLTTLYNFCAHQVDQTCVDGSQPDGLAQGTDGNFYSTTASGGDRGAGTIFKITPSGAWTMVNDNRLTTYGLFQATNGDFYGPGGGFGPNLYGTIFRLSVGLDPFVKTLPHAAKVGAAFNILGTDLTGATSVSFNGTPATFTVVSPTEIAATVPAGATAGKIEVTTPGGTLSSGGPFLVLR